MDNPKPEKFLLRIYFSNGRTQRIQRTNKARLSAFMQRVNFSKVAKCHLRVTYSYMIDCFNKKIEPVNEGIYTNKKDLFYALQTFTEK